MFIYPPNTTIPYIIIIINIMYTKIDVFCLRENAHFISRVVCSVKMWTDMKSCYGVVFTTDNVT